MLFLLDQFTFELESCFDFKFLLISMIVSENLGSDLDEFLSSNLPQVRLVRAKQRQGLIRARIIGADSATGEVHASLDTLIYLAIL